MHVRGAMRWTGRRILFWLAVSLLFALILRLLVIRGSRLSSRTMIGNDDIRMSHRRSIVHQDTAAGAPSFAAGTYMAGLRPGNGSSCRWYHGLPDVISYTAAEVSCSPEIGEKSPYRALPFVLRGTEERNKLPQVTLCTHATADHVYGIVELARRWEGPLSLAIFTPGLDAGIAVALLDRACRCEPEMYKVSRNGSTEVSFYPNAAVSIPQTPRSTRSFFLLSFPFFYHGVFPFGGSVKGEDFCLTACVAY